MVHVKLKSKAPRVRKGTIRKKLLIVVHTRPDWDAVVGVFLWLIIHGFTQLEHPKALLFFAFVPPGKRVSKQTLDDINPNMVVHLDTGTIFNPQTNDFDHHPSSPDIEPQFDSTAALLQAVYSEELAQFPWLDDLIYATDRKDCGQPIETRDLSVQDLRITLNRELQASGFVTLRIVDELEPFRNWINVFSNLPCSDEDKMRTGLSWLFGWHELCRPKTERIALVAQADVVQSANGVRIGILPATTLGTKQVRNQLRVNRDHGFDAYLCIDIETGRARIGITCLNDKVKSSMDGLFAALKEKYNAPITEKKIEIFLHARRFVMYLYVDIDTIPNIYTEVQKLAIQHLRRE